MKRNVQLTENEIRQIISECVKRFYTLNEDLTRGQVDDQIEDFMKTKAFEKRVNNIVVDVIGEFIENMWLKKSFWKTMIKKK